MQPVSYHLSELELRRAVRLNGGAESDEASLIGWSLLVREVLKYSRQVMMKVYVADRTRCEAQLRAWTAPSRKSYDFIGMACCLCKLELTYDLPRGRTMQKKPYICTSPYSVTFEEHLRKQHWRRGCQCSSCGKILQGDGGGRGHIIQKQKRDGRHEGAVLIPLTASWICMQRRGPFDHSACGALGWRCTAVETMKSVSALQESSSALSVFSQGKVVVVVAW